jgi:hypothetical protein
MIIHLIGNRETREVTINGRLLDPGPSQKIHNHSPDGFNWGYGGSGPAQLALAVMMDQFPLETARRIYQKFKWDFIAKVDGENNLNLVIDTDILLSDYRGLLL